jgi:hypothetical protein
MDELSVRKNRRHSILLSGSNYLAAMHYGEGVWRNDQATAGLLSYFGYSLLDIEVSADGHRQNCQRPWWGNGLE